jgi:hypothetical protein
MAAFRPCLRALQLPWSKPQQGNLFRLGTAFCQERRLPLRRLTRGWAGPGKPQRAPEKRLRRFLGSNPLDLPGALAAWRHFLLRAKSSLVASAAQGQRLYPDHAPTGATRYVPQATVLRPTPGTRTLAANFTLPRRKLGTTQAEYAD